MAYQQNHTALATADLDQRARILALAERLDLMLTAKSNLADWERRLTKNRYHFANLTIISWHNARGAAMTNTTSVDNPTVLLPVQDGEAAGCHAEGVKFIRVSLALDFSDLSTTIPPPTCVLRGMYYIELPQWTVQLMDGNGNQYNLTTYHGAGDLRNLTADAVKLEILDETHQDGPFELLEPPFNITSCQTDSSVVYRSLKRHVVLLASDSVHQLLFSELVPGYSMEPHSVLEHIWQSYVDDKGAHVRLSAQVYYTTFPNAIHFFYDMDEYPIDIAGVFMSHIHPTYSKGFKSRYPNHAQIRDRSAVVQRQILSEILTTLSQAETDESHILEIVGGDKCGGEQFHGSTPSGSTFPSLAERTISSYDTGGTRTTSASNSELKCFGCGGPHSWSEKKGRNWVIICPQADQPGVRDHAKDEIAKFRGCK